MYTYKGFPGRLVVGMVLPSPKSEILTGLVDIGRRYDTFEWEEECGEGYRVLWRGCKRPGASVAVRSKT